ncbi:MAG: hypothetical protein AAF539_06320, partial [Planctomycetota bacterium]
MTSLGSDRPRVSLLAKIDSGGLVFFALMRVVPRKSDPDLIAESSVVVEDGPTLVFETLSDRNRSGST